MTEESPTDKLFVASLALPPGGSKVLQDGEYTVRIDRAAPARQPGWYLALTPTGGQSVALYWDGGRWEMQVPAEPVLANADIIDRLLPYREVLALLEGLSAAETRLERKYRS